jgi:hypothetical protein
MIVSLNPGEKLLVVVQLQCNYTASIHEKNILIKHLYQDRGSALFIPKFLIQKQKLLQMFFFNRD